VGWRGGFWLCNLRTRPTMTFWSLALLPTSGYRNGRDVWGGRFSGILMIWQIVIPASWGCEGCRQNPVFRSNSWPGDGDATRLIFLERNPCLVPCILTHDAPRGKTITRSLPSDEDDASCAVLQLDGPCFSDNRLDGGWLWGGLVIIYHLWHRCLS
jgi:hypothetical protein